MPDDSNPSNRGSRSSHPPPPKAVLDELAAEVRRISESDASSAGPHWGAAHKLLLKAKVPPMEILPLIANRDLTGLQRIVARLRGEAPLPDAAVPSSESSAAQPREPIDPDTLRHAMKAFRHRLKVTRLDAESKLGVGPMSGGRKHGIDAITPPREYPTAVWEALADEGKLRRCGPGFYGLAEEAG